MRILMLSQFYPPIIGGGSLHVQSLSAELVSRGHDVAVITLWQPGQAEFELDQGVRVYRIHSLLQRMPGLFSDKGRPYAPPFPDPEVMLILRRIIKDEHPEIVHAHNWLVYSFLPLKAWSGAQLVVTLHNSGRVCVKTTLLYRGNHCTGPAFRKCIDCAAEFYGLKKGLPIVLANRVMRPVEQATVDMFLPVSKAVAIGNGLVDNQLPYQIVHNFIPDNISVPKGDIEPYLAQLPGEDYLLFVGALNRQKGIDVLLRAYADLSNAPPLVLIGYESPEWEALSAGCPNKVFVFKNWPRSAVMEAWQRSIIALLPSVGPESCPTVVMEAMTVGCPVVASRIGGIPELVADGETGLLVEPGNSSALRRAMEELLTNPELRRQMGQAGLRKVVNFQASTVVPRIVQVYEELLQEVNPLLGNDLLSEDMVDSKA